MNLGVCIAVRRRYAPGVSGITGLTGGFETIDYVSFTTVSGRSTLSR